MQQNRYDYIITGAGCAGLSFLMHLIHAGAAANKKILLVDVDEKNKNDRTWCFWEEEAGLFQSIVHKQWNKLWFYGEGVEKELTTAPYTYKMIRGIDFYNHCRQEIGKQANIDWLSAKVERIFSEKETGIVADGQTYFCQYIFNSILFHPPSGNGKHHWLLQHFKGWMLHTATPQFDADVATLMDFRIAQTHGTSFCYVLPVSSTQALVEYTLFTPSLLQQTQYDEGLKKYIEDQLGIKQYSIQEEEFGVIPMTDYAFPHRQENIIHLGTAGGQTKGSSGYTFYFIQKHSAALVHHLKTKGNPFIKKGPARFQFYDSVLLHILQKDQLPGRQIFSTLFKKNKGERVLRFLNNESTLLQEVGLISSLPTLPFLKAAIQKNF